MSSIGQKEQGNDRRDKKYPNHPIRAYCAWIGADGVVWKEERNDRRENNIVAVCTLCLKCAWRLAFPVLVNPLYTGGPFDCYLLDDSFCHLRGVASVLSLLFYI